MVLQELLIFPKGFLKIVNGIFLATALVCIAVSEIKGGTSEIGYYESWIAILCVALVLCGLMVLFVALANSNKYNKTISLFYLLDAIMVFVGSGFACQILEELNREIGDQQNAKIVGYWEFVVAVIFSFFAGITHFLCAILHLVYRKNVIDPIDNLPDEKLTTESSTF